MAAALGTRMSRRRRRRQADAVLDALFVPRGDDGSACVCSCHPRLGDGSLHDQGFDCPCQRSAEERRASWAEAMAEVDAYWASPEGQAEQAARDALEVELREWLSENPDVVVESHGGWAPEQWEGSVDGRAFYFRERHGHWHIELDLRPTGRFVKVWTGGSLDDEDSTTKQELTEGDVIGEGTDLDDGYGSTPAERIAFIVAKIRTHAERERCQDHAEGLADIERALGARPRWCPTCGTPIPALAD